MNVLDLFSGIGGFSLGLHRAGMITVAFCEIEPYPQAVLRKNFPGVPIYDDVRTLTAARLKADGVDRVDVITGGFPCQDVSIAGKTAGVGEEERSGLFREILRLATELRPEYIIMENVTNLLSGDGGRWFRDVLGGVAEIGYDAEWHCIPAKAIGAIHGRDRIWIIAYTEEVRRRWPEYAENSIFHGRDFIREAVSVEGGFARDKRRFYEKVRSTEFIRTRNGIPGNMGAVAAYGNSVMPQIPEIIGRAIMSLR